MGAPAVSPVTACIQDCPEVSLGGLGEAPPALHSLAPHRPTPGTWPALQEVHCLASRVPLPSDFNASLRSGQTPDERQAVACTPSTTLSLPAFELVVVLGLAACLLVIRLRAAA